MIKLNPNEETFELIWLINISRLHFMVLNLVVCNFLNCSTFNLMRRKYI